jgi:hypothetical protein
VWPTTPTPCLVHPARPGPETWQITLRHKRFQTHISLLAACLQALQLTPMPCSVHPARPAMQT